MKENERFMTDRQKQVKVKKETEHRARLAERDGSSRKAAALSISG